MADASDSKSDEGDFVWVQVPSPAYKGSVAKSPEYVIERHFPFLEKRKLAENLCTLIFCQFFSHLNKAFIFCWNFRLTLL